MGKKIEPNAIKEKRFTTNKPHTVTLTYDGKFYSVYVDVELYYRGANEIFAMQKFNEI